MIMLIICISFIILISLVVYLMNNHDADQLVYTTTSVIICSLISSVFVIGTLWFSYMSSMDLEATYKGSISVYKDAITMYEDKAVLDMSKATLSDFKYQGYQDNMKEFIKDLRKTVIVYNKKLIKKRRYNVGKAFGLLIIDAPEELKIVELIE